MAIFMPKIPPQPLPLPSQSILSSLLASTTAPAPAQQTTDFRALLTKMESLGLGYSKNWIVFKLDYKTTSFE